MARGRRHIQDSKPMASYALVRNLRKEKEGLF